MRINKYLTDKGFCSRREADRLIEQKRVFINNKIAVLGDQVDAHDEVKVDGQLVMGESKKLYLMYNKPRGVVCTTDLRDKNNIIDAIKYKTRIFPIGRLDKDSTGLIFLTNDGDIVNQILRAQYGHEKEYEVNIDKPFDDDFFKKMSQGVDIGDHVTLPCRLRKINKSTFSIILTEGKNRQIRRMCETLGYKVRHLNRVRIMNVVLGDLKAGEIKEIPTKQFVELQKTLTRKSFLKTDENIEE